LAKVLKTKVVEIGDKELKKGLNETTKKIENEIKKAKGDTTKIKSTTKSLTSVDVGGKLGKVDLISLSNWEGGAKKIDSPKVELKDVKFSNKPLTDETTKYFGESLDAYDKVNDLFYAESKDSKYTYGEYSLWQEYNLANYLGQGKDVLEILSKINNEYPESVSDGGSSANELINFNKMLSSDGASAYSSKDDIYIELISVTEPSVEESSVSLHYYSSAGNRAKQPYYKGSEILNVDNKGETTVNLVKFTETTAYFNCTYKPDPLKKEFKTITVNTDKEVTIKECKGIRIVLDEINLKKVADVKITPITRGRTRESNFTFSIGIEKRGISMDLTPEEANKKIEQLNKQISEWKNITEALSKVIEADKIACLGTSALINIKNLFAGKGGEATARKEVMQKWNSLCESVEFQKQSKGATNQEDCIANNYDQYIKPEIEATKTIMSQYNTDEKSMRDANTDSKTKLVNDQAAKMALIDKINSLVLSNTQVKDETGALKDSSYIKGILDKNNVNYTDYNDLSALYLDIQMISQAKNPKVVEEYQKSAYDKLSLIEERKKTEADAKKTTTIGGVAISQPITTKRDQWTYTNGKYDSKEFYFAPGMETQYQIKSDNPIAIISPYLFVLAGNREVYTATDVYEIINGHLLVPIDDAKKKSELINSHVFIPADQSSYKNKCKNCNSVKVFALEPYKGMPSLLPFDCENGWYVEVKQIMPNGFGFASGSAKSYFDSGALNSFWLCNVGSDGMMDGVGIDKNCIKFELSSGQPLNTVSGLSETEAKKKVEEAVKAVRDAQKKLTSNPTSLYNIGNCAPLKVKTVEGGVDGKCTDFMSPSDCQRIFNVCDPVVCPNSRCDFGGKFKVDNVIQSGIVGSTFLCLPNFIGFHPKTGVVVPVCLTGIHAGIEGWISILESYRDCINESVTNNKTVGICDMVNSVYVCDFFWRNAGPFAEALIKNLFLFAFGKGEHGGAEYAFVQDAWNNAENSMKYFQTAYAKDSKLTFGFKEITSSVVAEVCKSPMSVSYPNNFDAMLEPESPVQFHAFFEEVSYTDATVPPSSQYKVFYHIFAGNDQGHYYQVYLKSPPNGIGYYGKDRSVVASGYVPAGETRTETKDFIDVSGFQELCVKIDNQDKCGFKSVSTSAALNYAKDAAINDQLSNHVTTERECVSGSQSFGAFLTPNIQQGVEEFANPELYNQGITRVCSGENPGKGVDESRWKDVGYCDDTSIRCWVDERSVKNAIQGAGIENKTLSEIEKMNIQNIINQGGYLNWDQADKEIKSLRSVYLEGDGSIVVQANDKKTVEGVSYSGKAVDYENRAYSGTTIKNLDEDIKALDAKIALSSQKAELWALRAQIYDGVTRAVNKPVETSGGDEEDNTDVKKTEMIISGETKNIVFDYSFGGVIQKPLYFKFVNGKWGWAEESSPSIWKTAQDTYLTSSDDRKNIISELIAEKTYDDGLGYFIQSIIDNPDRHIETAGEDKKIAFQGTSQSYSSDPAQVFILINNDKKLYISFQNNNWKWNNSGKDGTWLPVFKVEEGKGLSSDLPKDFWDVINKLFNNNQQIDYNSALEIIFDFNLS
jgi:hypothetical protein